MNLSRSMCALLLVCSAAFLCPANSQSGTLPETPNVMVLATDRSASEQGTEPAVFMIVRSGSTDAALEVAYELGGTASNGVDYEKLPLTVTIPIGASYANITVKPIDDTDAEGPEDVVLKLVSSVNVPPAYNAIFPSAARVEIKDNEPVTLPPTVGIVALDPEGHEQSSAGVPEPIVFAVKRTGPLDQPLTVFFSIDGSAINGVDYHELSGKVVLNAGADIVKIPVLPIDDTLAEGLETVVLKLELPPLTDPPTEPLQALYRIGENAVAKGVIVDNDQNRSPEVKISKPTDGAIFPSGSEIPINALAVDPDGWVPKVKFFANGRLIGEREIVFIVKPEPGQTQNFEMIWSNVLPGAYVLTIMATDDSGAVSVSTPVRIIVAPQLPALPVVNVMSLDAVAREGTTNIASFRVHRTGPTNEALLVSYTVGGTAENGVDYEKLPGSIEIPAGKRSARILVQPIDDKIAERIETVVLRLSPSGTDPQTYAPGLVQAARALIVDNDQRLAANARVAGDNIHFHFDAPKGMRYRIETSNDLVNWRPVCSNVAGDAGASVVEDATAGAGLFYRLMPETSDFDAE